MEQQAPMANAARGEVSRQLCRLLAESHALSLKTQNFHWNVVGPNFAPLHQMFEAQYQELAAATDDIAERIRALCDYAPGSYAEFAELSRVPDAIGPRPAERMVRELAADHALVVQVLRALGRSAAESGDEATVDLVGERLRSHEKAIWMLRVQSEAQPG